MQNWLNSTLADSIDKMAAQESIHSAGDGQTNFQSIRGHWNVTGRVLCGRLAAVEEYSVLYLLFLPSFEVAKLCFGPMLIILFFGRWSLFIDWTPVSWVKFYKNIRRDKTVYKLLDFLLRYVIITWQFTEYTYELERLSKFKCTNGISDSAIAILSALP